MKNKNALKKIKKIAGIVILAILGVTIALVMLTSIINRAKNKPTFIFGYSLLWVSTGSMQPQIEAKSYILVRSYGGEDLTEGEVITFVCTDKTSAVYGGLITHRIVEVLPEGYITMGDDSLGRDKQTVFKEDIVGVYVKNLNALTFFGRLYASPAGLIALIGTFFGACAFVYVPDIVSALKEDKTAEEKQKLIDEKVKEEVEKLKAQNAPSSVGADMNLNGNKVENEVEKSAYKPVNGTFANKNATPAENKNAAPVENKNATRTENKNEDGDAINGGCGKSVKRKKSKTNKVRKG